ncbi:hypothetical protein GA617_05425 [Bifidobacterium adolescentis]|nr:hypothetical protein GA617_05425 [Bifidobacterium adolescentis]
MTRVTMVLALDFGLTPARTVTLPASSTSMMATGVDCFVMSVYTNMETTSGVFAGTSTLKP